MIAVATRLFALALLAAPATAAAQQVIPSPRPGGSAPRLPPHIASQLWPERELSPTELELKNHVITLGDSLTRVEATGAQVERHFRSGASTAVVRSSARNLASDCVRAGRTTGPVGQFAATLSTSDPKWGEPAVRAWRLGLTELARQLTGCEQGASAIVSATDVSAERLATVADRVGRALVEYRRSEQALLRTLKITIDPGEKAT